MAGSMRTHFLQSDLVLPWGRVCSLGYKRQRIKSGDWNTCGAARLWLAASCLGIRWSWSAAHGPHAIGTGRTKQVGWSSEGMEKIFSQEIICGAVDMARRLRALATFAEDKNMYTKN